MARRPKIRASFYDDAQFLLRLGRAIEMDASLPREWRIKVQEQAKSLAVVLMTAPARQQNAKKAS